jgi:type VI secretion system secreted protein Hcp
MAVDFFLKIDGIPGESADQKHKDEIDVLSWSWGAQQTGTMAYGGGGGAGKVQFQDFHFTQHMNKATPKLILACASGEHIKKAVMVARKAGKDQQEYMKITFTDLMVANYSTGGGGDTPIENLSLNFSKVEFEYKPQNEKGGLDAAITTGWDLKKNVKV